MSFEKQARRQAQILIDALAKTAQTEIDAMRAAVEARTGALNKALSHTNQTSVLDSLVRELSGAASEEAEARAVQVRQEVQKQAEAALAAARADVDRTRKELEARLAEAQKAHVALAGTLADAQKDVTAARSERDARTAGLAEAQERIRPLEQERKQLQAARDEANKLLEREAKRAMGLAADLDLARRESEAGKAELDGLRKDLKRTGDNVLLLERVGAALQSINAATTAAEVFETLVECLGKYFGSTVVFQVGTAGIKPWLGRGFGKTLDIGKIAIPRTIEALLKRTVADRKTVTVASGDSDPPIGLSGNPVGSAVALPVITGDRVIAVAYAEAAEDTSPTWGVGCKLAELLIDHVSRRLTAKPKAAAQA